MSDIVIHMCPAYTAVVTESQSMLIYEYVVTESELKCIEFRGQCRHAKTAALREYSPLQFDYASDDAAIN